MGVCSSNAASAEPTQMAPKVIQVQVRDSPPRKLQAKSSNSSNNTAQPSTTLGAHNDATGSLTQARPLQSSPGDDEHRNSPLPVPREKRLAVHSSSSPQPPASPMLGATSGTAASSTMTAHHASSSSSFSPHAKRHLHHASADDALASRKLSVPIPTSASSSSLAHHGSVSTHPTLMTLTPHASHASFASTATGSTGSAQTPVATVESHQSSRSASPAPQAMGTPPFPGKSPSRSAVGFHRPPSMSPVTTGMLAHALNVPPLPVRDRKPQPIREYESHSAISTTDVQGQICSSPLHSDRAFSHSAHNSISSRRAGYKLYVAPTQQDRSIPSHQHNGSFHSTPMRSPLHQRLTQRSPTNSPNPQADDPVSVRTRAASVSAAPTSAATSAMPSAAHTPMQHSPVLQSSSSAYAQPLPHFTAGRPPMHSPTSSSSSSDATTAVVAPRADHIVPQSRLEAEAKLQSPDGSFTNANAHHMTRHISLEPTAASSLCMPSAIPSLAHSKTVPADMSAMRDATSPSHIRHESDSHLALPGSARANPPTFQCTKTIEFGLTVDGYAHINQYIIEISEKKRERMQMRELRRQQREERSRSADEATTAADTDWDVSEADETDDDDDDDEDDASILGRGSYGLVKKVFNSQDNQFYAMKIMSKDLLARGRGFGRAEDAIDSVKREIAILKKLDHPNVVRLYEVMCDAAAGKVYMIMEFAEQGPVMRVDLDDGEVQLSPDEWNIVTEPLPLCKARAIFRDVLSGLDYLHHQAIIHRDIKPENLLLAADGRAMIADFGVSTLCEGDECLISSTAGTAAFMSPEMVRSGAKSSGFGGAQTDVWSLGVTLFFFVYGRLPWYARSLPEIYRLIVEAPLSFPEGPEFAHLPAAVRCLISGMLDKNPKTRKTIAEMQRCPWVSDEGNWCPYRALAETAGPEAAGFKSKPLVADQLCSKDIATAISSGAKPLTAGANMSSQEQSTFVARMRARLANWRRDLKRQCAAKKEEKRKRKMQAHFLYVAKLPVAGITSPAAPAAEGAPIAAN